MNMIKIQDQTYDKYRIYRESKILFGLLVVTVIHVFAAHQKVFRYFALFGNL